MIELILGGSGCGKSAYAEERITGDRDRGAARYYLATMQIYGEEGLKKVERHRRLRAGKGFETIECPRDLIQACELIPPQSAVLLECMSNLVANEMFDREMRPADVVREKIIAQITELSERVGHLVIVSNNVFEDGIDYDEGTLAYLACLGAINVYLAGLADHVTELVAGIPIVIK